MNIRNCKPEEIDAILDIVKKAIQSMNDNNIFQWDEVYPDRKLLLNDIEKQELYAIEQGKNVTGFMALNETQSPEYETIKWKFGGRVLVVHRLTIDPKYQRQGFANILMDFAEKKAFSENYNSIRLDAFVNNPAAFTLYEKRGYNKAGKVRFRKGDFYCFEKKIN
jgi:ribosomal protein S18 acetylase RimI-like enzyme